MAKRARLEKPGYICNRSELDLFASPKEQDPTVGFQDVVYRPVNSIENEGPILFRIPSNEQLFTDLAQIFLSATVKVIRTDKSTISTIDDQPTRADKEAPQIPEISVPNDFFDCQFSKISLEINNVRVGSEHNLHPQIAVCRILVSYSNSTADYNLKNLIGWIPDAGSENRELMNKSRYGFIEKSKPFNMIGRISHDMFNSSRLMPPRNSMTVRFDRTLPEFSLIRAAGSTKTYKVSWIDAHLIVRRVKLADSAARTILSHIDRGLPYYLPFIRTDARSFEIPKGSSQWRANSLFMGTLPERALFVLVESDSVGSGSYENNPVVFPAKEFKLSYVQFFVDDKAVLPKPYEPDWKNQQYQQSYHGLLRTLGFDKSLNSSMGFDYEAFGKDYGLFGVSFRGVDSVESGAISVEVRFKSALPKTVIGILIPEYRSCTILDENKSVNVVDY